MTRSPVIIGPTDKPPVRVQERSLYLLGLFSKISLATPGSDGKSSSDIAETSGECEGLVQIGLLLEKRMLISLMLVMVGMVGLL